MSVDEAVACLRCLANDGNVRVHINGQIYEMSAEMIQHHPGDVLVLEWNKDAGNVTPWAGGDE